jgi:Mn2+/Fe2+ NRAMP family transporter
MNLLRVWVIWCQGGISSSHGGEYEDDCLLGFCAGLVEVYRRIRAIIALIMGAIRTSETSVLFLMCKHFFSVALQSFLDPGRLTYRRFLELFKLIVGLLGRVISPSQGLYLHRTTQCSKTRTNIHALSGIRTHDPGNQSASDRTTTVTGICKHYCALLYITR